MPVRADDGAGAWLVLGCQLPAKSAGLALDEYGSRVYATDSAS